MMKIKEFVCACVVIALFVGVVGVMGGIEHNYTRKDCKVIGFNGDTVMVEDKCGYVWAFEDEENYYKKGDTVTLKMHTNHTHDTIRDDYVTGVKK